MQHFTVIFLLWSAPPQAAQAWSTSISRNQHDWGLGRIRSWQFSDVDGLCADLNRSHQSLPLKMQPPSIPSICTSLLHMRLFGHDQSSRISVLHGWPPRLPWCGEKVHHRCRSFPSPSCCTGCMTGSAISHWSVPDRSVWLFDHVEWSGQDPAGKLVWRSRWCSSESDSCWPRPLRWSIFYQGVIIGSMTPPCLFPTQVVEMDLDKVLVAKLLLALSSPPPIRVIIDAGEFLHF